jgi:hypothetical protein
LSDPIVLIDDIGAKPGCRAQLLELFESDYVPAARERGLELDDISLNGEDDVCLRWTLADVPTFWRARRGSMMDPGVARFWADAAPMIERRARRWPQHSFDEATAESAEPVPPSTHHIVLLADSEPRPPVRISAGKTWIGQHLPGSVGPADASLEVALEAGSDVRLVDVPGAVDVVALGDLVGGALRTPGIANAIKRTLLLRVRPEVPINKVAEFEQALLGMPHHIDAIRNWRLSRVAQSQSGWTHCWEQEYETLSGLKDDYMSHPYHWAHVDGFFDHEDPKCIVEPEINHLYFEIESSILAAMASSSL